jgi:hypothetical protein
MGVQERKTPFKKAVRFERQLCSEPRLNFLPLLPHFQVGDSRLFTIATVIAVVFFWVVSIPARAQGTLTVLQTGGGQPLVTSQQTVDIGTNGGAVITFNFGFVTSEVPAPGVVLDSFSVSVQDQMSDLALLLTADASGVTWAPYSPGAAPITDSQIIRQAITPPSDSPVLGQGLAYFVQFPVPAQFMGDPLTVYFDLYDNLSGASSLGWYEGLSVVTPVPEPRTVLMAGLGLILIVIKKKFGRCP